MLYNNNKHKYCINNIAWSRKPCDDHPEWSNFRIEDLFECHICKKLYPWFKFRDGKTLLFGDYTPYDGYKEDTYIY